MKQRKLVIGLLVILAVAVSGFTFAFWGSQDLTEVESSTIEIGSARTVTTTASLSSSGGSLVPSGRINDSVENDATESITLTYTLTLTDDAEYAGEASYTISLSNFSNAALDPNYESSVGLGNPLFNFAYTANGTITPDEDETITIVITFAREPLDATEYDLINGETLTFNVTFTTAPVVNP